MEIKSMEDLMKTLSIFEEKLNKLSPDTKNEIEVKQEAVETEGASSTDETTPEGTNNTSPDSSDENVVKEDSDTEKLDEISKILGF